MGESGTTAASPASSAADAAVLAPASDPVTRVLGSAPSSINQPNAPQNIPRTPPSHGRPLKCPIVQPTIAPDPHQRTNQIISSAFTSAQPTVASHCPMQSRSNRVGTRTHRVRNEAPARCRPNPRSDARSGAASAAALARSSVPLRHAGDAGRFGAAGVPDGPET